MAARLLSYEVADLCLGKPSLPSLSISATIGDAVAALKGSEDNFISVWSCNHSKGNLNSNDCVCVGKICMVDIIYYLCKEENLLSPSLVLQSPVSVLLSKVKGLVKHVEPSSSLLEVIDLMLQGAQNLVVPIRSNSIRKQLQKPSSTTHNVCEFCWLTLEDVIRFLLCSIGLFSPIPTLSIDSLGIISTEFLVIGSHSPAASAGGAIYRSLLDQTSVAVVDDDGILIGEISPSTLAACGTAATAAIATLSAGELMAYIDCGGDPAQEISRVVEARLKERNLEKILDKFMTTTCEPHIASLDNDLPSPRTTVMSKSGRYSRSSSYSAQMVRRAEEIVCHPGSSLVAVMLAVSLQLAWNYLLSREPHPVALAACKRLRSIPCFQLVASSLLAQNHCLPCTSSSGGAANRRASSILCTSYTCGAGSLTAVLCVVVTSPSPSYFSLKIMLFGTISTKSPV